MVGLGVSAHSHYLSDMMNQGFFFLNHFALFDFALFSKQHVSLFQMYLKWMWASQDRGLRQVFRANLGAESGFSKITLPIFRSDNSCLVACRCYRNGDYTFTKT